MGAAVEPLDRVGAPRSGWPVQVNSLPAAIYWPSPWTTSRRADGAIPTGWTRASQKATRFTLGEGSTKTLDLKLASQ